MNIDLYQDRNTGRWGYTVNGHTGGSMGGFYQFRWMAWLAAKSAERRIVRRDYGCGS